MDIRAPAINLILHIESEIIGVTGFNLNQIGSC